MPPHAYEQHLQEQHHDFDPPLECMKCDQRFRMADAVKYARHIEKCQRHACEHPGCKAAFSGRYILEDHVLWCHTSERPHTCVVCGLERRSARLLANHMYTHADEPAKTVICDVEACTKRFFSKLAETLACLVPFHVLSPYSTGSGSVFLKEM